VEEAGRGHDVRRPGVRREQAGRAHGVRVGARHGGARKAHCEGAGEDRGGGIPPRRCGSGPRTALRCAVVGDWTVASSTEA
jgi:hypothetical protein